jgi:hypothetical protein
MRSLLASIFGGLLLGGCAVAPYDYGYGRAYYYDSPAYYGYYDYGPTYYYPGYYGGIVGPPAVVGSFQYRSGGGHWKGSTRQRSTVQPGTSRSSTAAGANSRSGRNAGVHRGNASRQTGARDREARRVARSAPSDHGS